MACKIFDRNDEESFDEMRAFFSPAHIDQLVREGLRMCWLILPKEKRNVNEVERHFRHIVDRALKDLKEDEQTFRTDSDS